MAVQPEPPPGVPTTAPRPDAEGVGLRRRLRRSARPPLRVVRSVAFALLRAQGRRHRADLRSAADRVSFLLLDAFAMGGTNRTVFTLAGHLARTRDVALISVLQTAPAPFFAVPAGVRLIALDKQGRTPLQRLLARAPSLLWNDADTAFPSVSLWTDIQLVRTLRALPPGVVIGTRPGLNILLARLRPAHLLTVGQQHLALDGHHPALRAEIARAYRHLDGFAVLGRDDERDLEPLLAGAPTRLVRIPNALPDLGPPRTPDLDTRVAVGLGRLTDQKGFDRLLPAFAQVVAQRPDWVLRIYGDGPEREALESQAVDLGLERHVQLMGASRDVSADLARASLFVLSSRTEGFPMVLLEAMAAGLPVVSFACPHGPDEILTDGEDGLLVPDGDIDALAAAVLRLVDDPAQRAALSRRARQTVARYGLDEIGGRWESFLDGLGARRAAGVPVDEAAR